MRVPCVSVASELGKADLLVLEEMGGGERERVKYRHVKINKGIKVMELNTIKTRNKKT